MQTIHVHAYTGHIFCECVLCAPAEIAASEPSQIGPCCFSSVDCFSLPLPSLPIISVHAWLAVQVFPSPCLCLCSWSLLCCERPSCLTSTEMTIQMMTWMLKLSFSAFCCPSFPFSHACLSSLSFSSSCPEQDRVATINYFAITSECSGYGIDYRSR